MPNLFPIRAKFLSAPTSKRLSSLSCLELRKQIQEASRKNLKMNLIWNQFMYEVCDRVSKYSNSPRSEHTDKFTPTDISLIFSSFSTYRKNNKQFYNYLLECVNRDSDTYNIRDVAILYNSLIRLNVSNEFVFESLNKIILDKLNSKISEKDISLLLNGLLDLRIHNVKDIFVKCSLILSSRIKYISNLHTLTLLLYSYSKLSCNVENKGTNVTYKSDCKSHGLINSCEKQLDVNDYEYIILTDVTSSLLSKCSDLLLQMRPTDLLYFYRSFLNLFFNSPEAKRNVYSNIVKLYKIHNQILQFKLEFQTRELLILLQLLSSSYHIVSESDFILTDVSATVSPNYYKNDKSVPDDGEQVDQNKYEVTSLEIYRNNQSILKQINDELVYRVKLMSFVDSFNFMNLLDKFDRNIELVFRRLYDKLNRDNKWEHYSNKDLLSILDRVQERSERYVSENMKVLAAIIIKKTPKTLKLRELCSILEAASALGIKSNSLSSKISTLECRCDNLDPDQIFTAFHHSVCLGYIDVLDHLLPHLFKVTDADHSIKLLLEIAILQFNSLKAVDKEIIDHLNSNIYSANIGSENNIYNHLLRYLSYFNKDGKFSRILKGNKECESDAIEAPSSSETNETEGLSIDFMRSEYNYVCSNLSATNYKKLLSDFTEDFENFMKKHDPKSLLKTNVELCGLIFPVTVEIDSKVVAIIPLFDDFYTTNRRMLKLSKYTQLKLFENLQIKYICVDLINYSMHNDKSNVLANLLQKSYTSLSNCENGLETMKPIGIEDKKQSKLLRSLNECSKAEAGNKGVKHLNNFDRFRILVSANM